MSANAVDLWPLRRPVTRDEYHRMGEAGLFEGERVELIRGVVVAMSPRGSRHTWVTDTLGELLVEGLRRRARVRVQNPLVAVDDSEPEPDVAVVARADYLDEHPREALLVIEVADSSLEVDLGVKARLYAESRFPEYWVVDLRSDEVVVHQGPRPDGTWRSVRRAGRDEALTVPGFDDLTLAVAAIVPPR